MIIYVTKQTAERYKLNMPEQLSSPLKEVITTIIANESGDAMREWGAKLFYFDHRKCLQVVNFASKFTLFLVDIKVNDLSYIGDLIKTYIYDIYKDNRKTTKLLERFFGEERLFVFSSLKNKSIISTLNRNQLYIDDGYELYNYIEKGILQTKKLNYEINTDVPSSRKIDGKTDYFYPAELFEQLLKQRYS